MRFPFHPAHPNHILVYEIYPGVTEISVMRKVPPFQNGPGQTLAYYQYMAHEGDKILGALWVEHEIWQDPHPRPVGKIEIKHVWKVIEAPPGFKKGG